MKEDGKQKGKSAKIHMTESFGIQIDNEYSTIFYPYSTVLTSLIDFHPMGTQPPI